MSRRKGRKDWMSWPIRCPGHVMRGMVLLKPRVQTRVWGNVNWTECTEMRTMTPSMIRLNRGLWLLPDMSFIGHGAWGMMIIAGWCWSTLVTHTSNWIRLRISRGMWMAVAISRMVCCISSRKMRRQARLVSQRSIASGSKKPMVSLR